MRSKSFLVLLCLAVSAMAWRSGLRGIDFGSHWDEGLHLAAVQNSARTGDLLPERYLYPSLTHAVMLALAAGDFSPQYVGSQQFKLRARTVFFAISFTTLIALGWLAHVLGWGAPTAALAVCLLASSWEFVYHSRWIAPDMLLAPFALLSLIAILRGRWFVSAVAAGLCCGAKYPGGLALLTGWIAMGFYVPRQRRGRLAGLALFTLIFALTYFATTPGTLLAPTAFLKDLQTQVGVYSSGHFGYSVPVGPIHLGRMLNYLVQVALSPYRLVAVLLFAFALYGWATSWRADRRQTLILTFLPLGWLLFFSLLKVMIARNFQVVVPYLALFSARGIWIACQQVGQKKSPLLAALCFAMLVGSNLHWLAGAPARPPAPGVLVRDLYTETRSPNIWLSPGSRHALLAAGFAVPVTVSLEAADHLIFLLPSEPGKLLHRLRANRPGRYRTAAATPQDANLDYYPTWTGADRPVSIRAGQARADAISDLLDGLGNDGR